MDLGLKGKVAIVTGGGRGIGKGCSTVLAQEGCSLAIADLAHDEDTRAYMDGLVKQYGVDVLELNADVSDENQIDMIFQAALEQAEEQSASRSTSSPQRTGGRYRKLPLTASSS